MILAKAHFVVGRAQYGVNSCRLLRGFEIGEEVGRADNPLPAQGEEFSQELLTDGVRADRDVGRPREGEQAFQDVAELEGLGQDDLDLALARVVDGGLRVHGL